MWQGTQDSVHLWLYARRAPAFSCFHRPSSRGIMIHPSISQQSPRAHELRSLLRFSFLFNRSTLFLCIFSAIFSYLSFSSFAARFVLMASIRA
jgi:hypothetical protein